MFKSQKPQLPAWQTGWGRGPAGGRNRFIDAAESPGEIKVKGSSPAKEETHPLFINQRGCDRAERCRRQLGGRRPTPTAKPPSEALPPASVGRPLELGLPTQHFQPSPKSEYPNMRALER